MNTTQKNDLAKKALVNVAIFTGVKVAVGLGFRVLAKQALK